MKKDKGMKSQESIQTWLWWSWVPGLHWISWIHAGLLARTPWYWAIGGLYALPLLLVLFTRQLSLRLLLVSWLLGIVHTQTLRPTITRHIAHALATAAETQTADEALRQALLRAAVKHGGVLSVTQGVLETGKAFPDVERVLRAMVEAGYIYTRNHPTTGILEYVFQEMM